MHGLLTRVRGCHFEVMPCSPEASDARPCDDDVDGQMTVLKLGSRRGESQHMSPLIACHKAVACTSHGRGAWQVDPIFKTKSMKMGSGEPVGKDSYSYLCQVVDNL